MQGNTVFYLAASQTALGGHKTYFYVYHNMPIEASTNSFKTPIFKGYSGCVLFGIIVASRAKVAPFALCLLGSVLPKPLLPAQALWLYCESAGFVIVMDGVFIEVVIFWCGVLVTIWCTVPFQNFVVIPDMLQVCELWFQLV